MATLDSIVIGAVFRLSEPMTVTSLSDGKATLCVSYMREIYEVETTASFLVKIVECGRCENGRFDMRGDDLID
jgi:hypothetical protein